MPPPSRSARPVANREFVNREKPIQAFHAARADLPADRHRILVYYGIGGQGKTRLAEKLMDILAAETPRRHVYGRVDLQAYPAGTTHRALLELRNRLRQSGPIRFAAFDVAIAVYWEKAEPAENIELALKSVLGDHEDLLGEAADKAAEYADLAESLPMGAGTGVKLVRRLMKRLSQERAKDRFEALRGIESLSAAQLLELLPYFLGLDLQAHRADPKARPPIVFLDTYEALWSDRAGQSRAASGETDAWVRSLVAEAPGTLFVILGRNRLDWDRRYPEHWAGDLEDGRHQFPLNGLADSDADRFLELIPVPEREARRAMIEAAKGSPVAGETPEQREARGAHPLFLDLSVDLYFDVKAKGRVPGPDDFGRTHAEIVERFLRHRVRGEEAMLLLLSAPRWFDRDLFGGLAAEYRTGYPATAFQEFAEHSFVEQGSDGRYRLHAVMRDHLAAEMRERKDPAPDDLNAFLFRWHDQRCQPASPREVNPGHEAALREAVYHRDTEDVEAALNWFWEREQVFYDAARYAVLEAPFRWALDLAETRLGPDHPKLAIRLNNMAVLLQATNRLAEAERLMRRALAINECSLGLEHPEVAVTLSNLTTLLWDTDRPDEAEPLVRRALAIDEKEYGLEHHLIAIRLNNLARLLKVTKRLAEAKETMRRALAIDERNFGPEHPAVARDLNNLATLLHDTRRLAAAKRRYERALAINEVIYGPKHPDVATGLNNLALVLQDMNRLGEAESLYRRALIIYEANCGPDHPNVANTLNNLAKLIKEMKRLTEAEPLSRRAVLILLAFTRATGHPHPFLRAALGNYRGILQDLNLPLESQAERFASLGPEAGMDGLEWADWLARLADSDEPAG